MDFYTTLWLVTDITLLLIIIFWICKWLIEQLRDICKNISGYVILGQILFVFLSWGIFLIIFIYYLFNPENVGVLNIFLTIIVGFLGTMIGIFFSDRAFDKIIRDLQERNERRGQLIKMWRNVFLDIKELLKEREKTFKGS